MKKIILFLLCGGLVICSACNKVEPLPTTSSTPIILDVETHEESTVDYSIGNETITIDESEEITSTEIESIESVTSEIVQYHSIELNDIIETSEPPQIIASEPNEEIIKQEIADSVEIERLVVQYINEYRVAQGDTTAMLLPGLTNVARYRATQLIENFDHVDIREVCGELKYGKYFDMTEYGMDASYNYYEGYDREAICKGEWFGSADMIAKNIATGFKNSTKHWEYVGDSKYEYIAVGIKYNVIDKYWYRCVCMSSENYGG